jgi:predicted TIM-barrel fold metal-dependent hydrolase
VIIDFHTHIFPPEVRSRRSDYLERDITFAEMYTSPKAKVAVAEDLAESMMASDVDISIALGFAWRDHEMIGRHNDYLLETAMRGEGRIVPFCTINMTDDRAEAEIERVAAAGVRGLGELRPESQGWDINGPEGERLAELALQHNLILLFHVTEPGGHQYPGKYGLSLASFVRFASSHRKLSVVGAHFAGGLPFALDNEARQPVSRVVMDTAARGYLYTPEEYRLATTRAPGRVVFGSDYPLLAQKREIQALRDDSVDPNVLEGVLGGNAAALLGLEA